MAAILAERLEVVRKLIVSLMERDLTNVSTYQQLHASEQKILESLATNFNVLEVNDKNTLGKLDYLINEGKVWYPWIEKRFTEQDNKRHLQKEEIISVIRKISTDSTSKPIDLTGLETRLLNEIRKCPCEGQLSGLERLVNGLDTKVNDIVRIMNNSNVIDLSNQLNRLQDQVNNMPSRIVIPSGSGSSSNAPTLSFGNFQEPPDLPQGKYYRNMIDKKKDQELRDQHNYLSKS